jgi:ABC-2 type transport system permease protein
MSALRAHAAAWAAVVERDVRVFRSYRLRPLTMLIAPLATVTLFYYVSRLVRVDSLGSSDGYFAYVVVGIAGLDVLTSTLALTPATLRQELVAGTFERLVLSPFGAARSTVAMLAFPLAQALVVATATIAIAAILFGLPVAWPQILLAPFAAALSALAFAPLGILVIAGVLVVKQTLSAASLVILALSLFAGAYFPVQLLPGWLEWVSEIQPLTPALELMRHLVAGIPVDTAPWLSAAKLAGFAIVLVPLSVWALQQALAFSRRRGTIVEY